MGFNNNVQSDYSTAIGSGNYVDNTSGSCTALGRNSYITGSSVSLAISGSVYNSSYALAINGSSTGNGSVAIGTDSGGQLANAQVDNQFMLGTSNHNVDIPGTLEVDTAMQLPTTAPATPQNGQIWITASGLYFHTNGSTYGRFITP